MLLLKKRYMKDDLCFINLAFYYFFAFSHLKLYYIYLDIFLCRVIQVNKVNLGKKAVQGRM